MNDRRFPRARLRRFIAAIEPWYNWGEIYVERMQGMHISSDGYPQAIGEGPVRYFELQWFSFHLQLQIGRTPSVTAADSTARHGTFQTIPSA